jgi:hypothetical protein
MGAALVAVFLLANHFLEPGPCYGEALSTEDVYVTPPKAGIHHKPLAEQVDVDIEVSTERKDVPIIDPYIFKVRLNPVDPKHAGLFDVPFSTSSARKNVVLHFDSPCSQWLAGRIREMFPRPQNNKAQGPESLFFARN